MEQKMQKQSRSEFTANLELTIEAKAMPSWMDAAPKRNRKPTKKVPLVLKVIKKLFGG